MSDKMTGGKWCVLTVCCLLLLAGAGLPVFGESHGEQVIRGEVFAEGYGDNGDVTAASVLDDVWGTVMVSPSGKGKELIAHVGAVVEVTGTLDESSDGDYVITVKSYTVVQDTQPENDPEDPEPYDE